MTTLKQVVKKIEQLSLAHLQIRSFFYNVNVVEWLNDHKAKYPAVFLQDNGSVISTSGHSLVISFKLFIMDLVHIAMDTKSNELDVESDMLSVAMDLVTQMNRPGLNWYLSTDNIVQTVVEGDNDMHAGVVMDFSIRLDYTQNLCEVPTTFTDFTPTSTDMNIYDLEYTGLGTEGSTLTIPELAGKKLLLITRESGMLYPKASAPDTAEYIWNGTTITFGLPIPLDARFLILYRNY